MDLKKLDYFIEIAKSIDAHIDTIRKNHTVDEQLLILEQIIEYYIEKQNETGESDESK